LSTGHVDFVTRYADYVDEITNSPDVLHHTDNTVSCYFRRAEYTFLGTFRNLQQMSQITVGSIHELIDLSGSIAEPSWIDNGTWLYNLNGPWSPDINGYFRDSNIMALLQTVIAPLLGPFSAGYFVQEITAYDGAGTEFMFPRRDTNWTLPDDLEGL
jgi:hypothetical protein